MKLYPTLLLFFLISLQVSSNTPQKNLSKVSLNGTWDFKYISGGEIPISDRDFFKVDFKLENWGEISVPSNWELQGKAEPKYAKSLEEGIGLYRTEFKVPDNMADKNIFICFDGVLFAYEVFVNGKYVGKWASAFNSQQFDISSFVNKNKTNVIAVKVYTHTENDSHYFDISDCWSLSGIFRDVSLIALPTLYLHDFEFTTELLSDNSARLKVVLTVRSTENVRTNNLTVEGSLYHSEDGEVYSFNREVELSEKGFGVLKVTDVINNPKLWSAENPNLYDLSLNLYDDGNVIHKLNKKVGIREVEIENGILLLNNTPIKMKGVCMHEIHPERGRALTDKDRIRDLTMAKNANINFIRTSHYPHNERFFEMCDSMGFYVMCEVPFNMGPPEFKFGPPDLDYLPDLLTRAEATVSKHKNHPCIITWSIGNENSLADIYTKVADYVAEKDPTRPRCFPQSPGAFKGQWTETPEVFNILAPHYLTAEELANVSKNSSRPIILSEYAHALGNSIDHLEDNWEVARTNQNIAGAAIWLWSDQGIKRNGNFEELNKKENHDEVWINSDTFYDGNHVAGNDGIVYSDRFPQIDYWLVQKVYSPIWVKNKKITTSTGKQNLKIEIENRLDFNTLKRYKCNWTLKHFEEQLESGIESLSVKAKSSDICEIQVELPKRYPGEFILTLNFIDSLENVVYKANIQVITDNDSVNYIKIIGSEEDKTGDAFLDQQSNSISISKGGSTFNIDNGGIITFTDKKTKKVLLSGAPVLRVGRKPTTKLKLQARRIKEKFYWDPYLIFTPKLISKKFNKTDNGFEIVLNYRWSRQEKEDEYIEGVLIFNVVNNLIHCNYELVPYNANDYFIEFGLGFQLPEEFSVFRWLGHGPYIAVPGKTLYNERDIWTLHKDDHRFVGNREKTDIAAFYEKDNTLGIGFIGDKSDFGVETIDNKIIVTNNHYIASFGTKVNYIPRHLIKANSVNLIKGNFSLLKIDNNSKLINNILPPIQNEVTIEKPFYNTYGF